MNDSDKKLNVLPGLAAVAVLVAIAALAAAVVAIGKSNDHTKAVAGLTGDSMSEMSGSMSGMSSEDMEHMAPVSINGITKAPSDTGNAPLTGVMRNGALEFTLDARPVWWRIYGKQRHAAYAYNGIVPGPQIHVRNGQRVRIRFTNNLPVETTIHWHGIGAPNSQDGVPGVTQQAIKPGASYMYEFTARPAGDPSGGGTFLYHSHVDEDRQMPVGLYGSLIIDPAKPAARYAVDRTLVFSEWAADAATGRTRGVMQMAEMLPNFFTVNGKSYPDTESVDVPAGKPVLLRTVNAGQFAHPLHLHGTSFRIVARDGHAIPRALQERRDTITLDSGERADIAFTEPPGKWLLHCHIGHHLTNDGSGPGGLITLIKSA